MCDATWGCSPHIHLVFKRIRSHIPIVPIFNPAQDKKTGKMRDTGVRFADIAGLDHIVLEMREIVKMLLNDPAYAKVSLWPTALRRLETHSFTAQQICGSAMCLCTAGRCWCCYCPPTHAISVPLVLLPPGGRQGAPRCHLPGAARYGQDLPGARHCRWV